MSNALCSDSTSGRKPGEQHVFLEAMLLDLSLERRPQLALAGDDEARVGHFADDERRRFDEVPLSLVRHERRDVADDRRLMREKQLLVQVGARRRRRRAPGRCPRAR